MVCGSEDGVLMETCAVAFCARKRQRKEALIIIYAKLKNVNLTLKIII
jgi:hypothetical protein